MSHQRGSGELADSKVDNLVVGFACREQTGRSLDIPDKSQRQSRQRVSSLRDPFHDHHKRRRDRSKRVCRRCRISNYLTINHREGDLVARYACEDLVEVVAAIGDNAYHVFVTIRNCLRSLLTSKQDPYKGHSNHDFTGI